MEGKKTIMGAIIGDIAGSKFEFNPIKSKDFELLQRAKYVRNENDLLYSQIEKGCFFTDDSIMTLAICDAILQVSSVPFHHYDDYYNFRHDLYKYIGRFLVNTMVKYGKKYPNAGYGSNFRNWLYSDYHEPYNSCGNGSAMRVSAVAYIAETIVDVIRLSKAVTEVTHNHPEGIKGAEATAVATWLALHGRTKEEIKEYIEKNYYKLDFDYDDLVKNYEFGELCQNTVPQSIYAFLISNSFEDAIKTTISLGGDADTMGAITGAIAGAYYGVPKDLISKANEFLNLDLIDVAERFDSLVKRLEEF